MKKIAAVIVSLVILFSSLPGVGAAKDADYVAKELTAYLYSLDDTVTMTCLFKDGLDIPFIDPEDYLNRAYTVEFSTAKNGDGTFTVSSVNGEMVIDPAKDTIHFDCFEEFAYYDALYPYEREDDFADYVMDDASYIYTKDSADPNALDLDLGKYGIDIATYKDKVYIPISTVSNIFSCSYQTVQYLDGAIYFNHAMEFDSYYDSSALFKTLERDPALIDFTYNELCFIVDNFYGFPYKCKASDTLREKGFDRTLDEYSDVSAKAKELLHSTSRIDYMKGLIYLDSIFDDGGHTSFSLGYMMATDYTETEYSKQAISALIKEGSEQSGVIYEYLLNMSGMFEPGAAIGAAKSAAFETDYENVKSWDGISLYKNGDTVIFTFDEFIDDVVKPFKWSLDWARDNGIENFVIDLTTNGGGSTEPMVFMLDLICQESSSYILNESSGNIIEDTFFTDRNLDEAFDDADLEVEYGFNFAILTSAQSFSAANLMPCMAKESGVRIIGERSGGGTCALSILTFSDGALFTLSSPTKITYEDGRDVDSGVEPDVVLTDGSDYASLFDPDSIRAAIAGENVPPKPQDTKEPEETNKPDRPSKPNKPQRTEPPAEPVISDGTALIAGASVTAVCAAAAVILIIISKKKERNNR